jgi:hypothetical protein
MLSLLPAGIGGLAQDATPLPVLTVTFPARPAVIRRGSCAAPGEPVAALPNLTPPRGPRIVQASLALLAQGGSGSVPLPFEALVQQPALIEVRRSPRGPAVVIACGEIGGTVDAAGVLTFGPRSVAVSRVTGMAQLRPNADGDTTVVAVFRAGDVVRGQRRATAAAVGGGTGAAAKSDLTAVGTLQATPRP